MQLLLRNSILCMSMGEVGKSGIGGGLISATAPAIHCGKTGIHLDVISSSMRGGE